ncbi:MAG: hypothetical protein KZQ95_17940 [Candidatus Thiodiazotropha sp. (ex Epidulcina cf. delphinae)]|nr:hypothetical protein [Candidatus Thiodiazotropha sp. (ex Epidulcina cf. delphinae)]
MAARTVRLDAMLCILLKRHAFALFLICAFAQIAVAEEDPYLSAISSEAEKVDAAQPAPDSGEGSEGKMTDGLSHQAFEDDLKARYMGSFTFYQKLPRRAREEVFDEYRGGLHRWDPQENHGPFSKSAGHRKTDG